MAVVMKFLMRVIYVQVVRRQAMTNGEIQPERLIKPGTTATRLEIANHSISWVAEEPETVSWTKHIVSDSVLLREMPDL